MKLRSRRPGFTLLEVLLASLIAILLLTGLYFAMDVTLRQTQESRDGVVVDGMARDVFNRVGIDLAATLGPLPPKSGGNNAGSAGSSGSSTTTTTTNDPTAVVATGAGTVAPAPDAGATTTTTTTDPSAASATPQAAPPQFQAGVIGEDWYMTAFVSRVPQVLADPRGLSQPADLNAATPSDLWRVTYWRRDDGRLCRQVRPWVTADDVSDPTSIDRSNEDGDTLADEITNVTFEYYGDPAGSTSPDWQQTWAGTTPGPDGVTPIGPPRAVRLTLTFSIPSSRPGGQPLEQTVSQVIPVRTAPGPNTPPLIVPSTDPGTVTPDNSGSGMGSGSGSGSNTTAGAGGGAAGGAKSSGGAAGGAKSSGSTAGAAGGAKSSGGAAGGAKSSGSSAPSAPRSTAPAAPSAPRTAAPAASSAPRSGGSAMPAAPSTGGGSRGGTGGGTTGGGGGGTGGGGTGGGGTGGGGRGGGR